MTQILKINNSGLSNRIKLFVKQIKKPVCKVNKDLDSFMGMSLSCNKLPLTNSNCEAY